MPPEATALPYPLSLADVAARSATLADFEASMQSYLLTLRDHSTRARVAATIADEPRPLAEKFPGGDAVDVCLSACAEWIATHARIAVPAWVLVRSRVRRTASLSEPAFDPFTPRAAPVLHIRPGRPAVSLEHKLLRNAERQRRFRARRAAELQQLRHGGRDRVPPARPKRNAPDITLDLRSLP